MKKRGLKVFAGFLAAMSVFTMTGGMIVSAESTEKSAAWKRKAEITEDEALKIAREDAGLKEKEIDKSRVELDYDDGILSYDVEFYVDNKEYDYEVDAVSGEILSMDYEIERDFSDSSRSQAKITEEEAVKTALKKVPGAKEEDLRMKLERDDGRLIYEGDILYEDMEYEFEINADNGKIISWERESIWD